GHGRRTGLDAAASERPDVLLPRLGRAHVRLADDLEEWDARAVEVDERVFAARVLAVLQRSRVLLEMRPGDAHALARWELEPSLHVQGKVVLRDLVALREIGVEVILPVELRVLGLRAVQREAGVDGKLDRSPVWDRECSRKAETNRA